MINIWKWRKGKGDRNERHLDWMKDFETESR